MTAWTKLDPNQLIPSELVQGVESMADALAGFLSDAEAALSLPSFPSLPSIPSAASAVAAAIIDAIQSLVLGGKVHVLVVPITKTVPRRPPAALPPTLDDLQAALDQTLGPSDTASADAYASMVSKTGGNAGFFTAFAESVMDPADPNRPQYDAQSDAVVMVTLLAGAPRFASIVSAASMFDQLTLPKGGNSVAARVVPVPQNLRARVVGSSSVPNVGVRVEWDAPQGAYASPYFPGLAVKVSRYAVIRSTDPRAQSARSVLDFFSTQTLTAGMTAGLHKVVGVGSGRSFVFLDDALADEAEPVYYCVAWETSVVENGGDASTLPFDRVSNVAKVEVKAPSPAQTGRAPNWTATGAAIGAFPPIARVAQRLIEETRVLVASSSDALSSSSSRLSTAMSLAAGASARLSARATELLDDVKRVSTTLSRAAPSLYVTQMSSGSGGNAFLLAELSRRLGDLSDASRPPFDDGEYVCGVCLVAGAPRLADLASVLAFFDALFGPAAPTNPLMGLLAAIDTAVTQAETAVFGPAMTPLPVGTTGVDPTTGKPFPPSTPAIAADGVAVATDDPRNPAAGDTNATPISELC